ncbi:MAG: GerAB/ArcD/ProY family transporter, partial [Thermacetogeniaceae bacterium]
MGIERGKISQRQTVLLVANTILASMVLYIPALLAEIAGQDAWISVLLAGVAGVVFGLLVVLLGMRHPNKDLVEYSIDLLGPWAGRTVGILFGLFFLYLNGAVVRQFSELLVNLVMPETPLIVFIGVIVALAAYGVYLGLEVFARVNELLFPLAFFIVMVFLMASVPEMRLSNLKPAFVHPCSALLRSSAILFSFYTEGSALLMFYPSLRRPEKGKGISYQVGIFLLILMMADVLGVIALFGPEETARMAFPTFELAKMVRLGGFIERIESLFIGVWVAMGGLKVMVLYYVSALAFAESWGLRDYRPIVLPLGMILASLAVLEFADLTQIHLLFRLLHVFIIAVPVAITLLLWLFTIIRGRERKSGGEQKEKKAENSA